MRRTVRTLARCFDLIAMLYGFRGTFLATTIHIVVPTQRLVRIRSADHDLIRRQSRKDSDVILTIEFLFAFQRTKLLMRFSAFPFNALVRVFYESIWTDRYIVDGISNRMSTEERKKVIFKCRLNRIVVGNKQFTWHQLKVSSRLDPEF
jgi:hypothetical protein